MANKEIIPYGFDPRKKLDMLALTVATLEVTTICSSQSYFVQAIHRLVMIAPPLPNLLLKDKPRQPDVPLPFKVTKEINLLPPRANEVLTGVKTNKFGDVTCTKYNLVTPHTIIDGVHAMPDQIKVVPSKEKKRRAPSPPIPEAEKRPRMTIALLEKKIEDLSNVIYTLEQRINEEHVYRKSLQHDLSALNHFVVKMKK